MSSDAERIESFIRTFKDENGDTVYWDKVQRMPTSGETSLVIDFQDLMTFDIIFSEKASENPVALLASLDEALLSVLKIEDEDYVKDTQRRLGSGIFKARITNYSEHVKLRTIRSKHIGHLIRISGILMRASEVKPLLDVGVFECRGSAGQCGAEIFQIQEEGRFTTPLFCDVCNTSKPPVKLLPEKSIFVDWQKVRIQESPEELPAGQMPRSVDVTLRGDIVDTSRPGDMAKVTGILQTSPDFSRRGGRLATFNIFIDANGIEVSEKEYGELEITEEDEREIKALAEDEFVHDRIFASIAPSIYGHDDIKESIALLLFGSESKVLPDGTRLRGRSNILMIGDPGTGKSQILKFVASLAGRGLYTSGKGTTAAGLTAAVVHDTDTGAMTLEAGALVLADQGIACIDEFDKMDPNDRTAIHEAMEQHTVSIAKAGIVATLNARTSILAAANPILGRYESSQSVQENIRLPFTILSRFDLIWILLDTVEVTKDRELAQFILGMHQMKKDTRKTEVAPITPEFLKKYIGYANKYVKPQLTSEAAEVIENFYVDLRSTAAGGAAPVPITARQLEALVRLAEARAKMALRSNVTKEDAQASVRLLEESLLLVFKDRITGKIDIDKQMASMDYSQRTSADIILKAMQDFEGEGIVTVSHDMLVERAVSMGLSAERAEEIIQKLQTDGALYAPSEGKFRLASKS